MSNEITIYHGSSRILENPVFGTGNPNNDYGLGFYCTQSVNLAKEWACVDETDGYANQYQLDLTGLSVLSLTGGDYHILNWLSVLLENRKFRTSGEVAYQAKMYLLETFAVAYGEYDIIRGYRADDSYFSFANAFLNNTISVEQLEKAMFLGKHGEQIVLKSEQAFECIRFTTAIPARSEIYLPKRLARDTAARKAFQEEKSRGAVLAEHYVLDILREGWKNDDRRLRRIVSG